MSIRPCGIFDTKYEKDIAIFRTKTHWFFLLAFLIGLFAAPLFLSSYWVSIFNFTAISIVAVLGLHILTGLCGQISIGHGAFLGIGAYTTAFLNNTFGMPILVTIVVSGLAAASVGFVFGLPALKVKGFCKWS